MVPANLGALRLGLVAAAIVVGVACTNSGLGGESAHTGTTATPGGDCPWVGSWDLTSIKCSAFEVEGWIDDFGPTTMRIEDDPDGGCRVATEIVGDSCTQEEDWHFTAPVGSLVDIELGGVSACQPSACPFAGGTFVCTEGSGARSVTGGYIAPVSGNLEARDLLSNTVPSCTIDVITTWAPK